MTVTKPTPSNNIEGSPNSEARTIANLVKADQGREVGQKLAEDYTNMGPQNFNSLLKQIQKENAKDVAGDKNLPGLEITNDPNAKDVDPTKTPIVSITSPGKIFGNAWRNSTPVFIEANSSQVGESQPLPKASMDSEARKIADLVKTNQGKEVGQSLAEDFTKMTNGIGAMDQQNFNSLLQQIQLDNAQDLAANPNLPGFEVANDPNAKEVDPTKNLTVSITTPGKTFGNQWRNSTPVFIEANNNVTAEGQDLTVVNGKSGVNIVAKNGVTVKDTGGSLIDAQQGTYVDADASGSKIFFEKGSSGVVGDSEEGDVMIGAGHVVALPGSNIKLQGPFYYPDGTVVQAAQVDAQPGAHVDDGYGLSLRPLMERIVHEL